MAYDVMTVTMEKAKNCTQNVDDDSMIHLMQRIPHVHLKYAGGCIIRYYTLGLGPVRHSVIAPDVVDNFSCGVR